MEDRWNELSASRRAKVRPENGHAGSGRESLVFYKDLRFWLILIMLSAFFAFTLVRFP
jgi:hypothetical protein